MRHVSHTIRARGGSSVASYVLLGLAAVGAGMLLVRAAPDLVRYLRIRRM